MKCNKCGKNMKYVRDIKFENHLIDGWKCICGEIYYDSEQSQKILMMNKDK